MMIRRPQSNTFDLNAGINQATIKNIDNVSKTNIKRRRVVQFGKLPMKTPFAKKSKILDTMTTGGRHRRAFGNNMTNSNVKGVQFSTHQKPGLLKCPGGGTKIDNKKKLTFKINDGEKKSNSKVSDKYDEEVEHGFMPTRQKHYGYEGLGLPGLEEFKVSPHELISMLEGITVSQKFPLKDSKEPSPSLENQEYADLQTSEDITWTSDDLIITERPDPFECDSEYERASSPVSCVSQCELGIMEFDDNEVDISVEMDDNLDVTIYPGEETRFDLSMV